MVVAFLFKDKILRDSYGREKKILRNLIIIGGGVRGHGAICRQMMGGCGGAGA